MRVFYIEKNCLGASSISTCLGPVMSLSSADMLCLLGPIENPMVPDGGLIFDLNPGCTSFQHEPLRSMGCFPHKVGTGDVAIGVVNQILTAKSRLRVKNTFLHIDVTDSEDEARKSSIV